MRPPALALCLLVLPATGLAAGRAAQVDVPAAPAPPVVVPVQATSPALPSPAPQTVVPLPGPPPPAAAATGAGAGKAGPPPATPAVPSRELIEKLGAGDRAYLAGDYRTALFAYQDAAYLDPTNAMGRIRLARAYAALGHKDQAERQLKQALELDPGNGEAQKLLEDLARPAAASPSVPAAAATPAMGAPAAASSPRVYRLTDDPAPVPQAMPGQSSQASPLQVAPPAPAVVGDQQEASRHYRAALALIAARDFKGAIVELDQALAINPQLGVAVAARASAFYGMARYQDAARDYEAALALVPTLATPIYGLAESYRRLGDPRAAGLYLRYAESGAADVKPELRETARQRAAQLAAP